MELNVLKRSVETVVKVGYSELERYICDYYEIPNRDWSFVADQECGNGCSISITVDGRLDEYDEKELKHFKTNPNNSEWITGVILDKFCKMGLIEAGEYLIGVGW